jgi:hypothetical protein
MRRVLLFLIILSLGCIFVFSQGEGVRRYVAAHDTALKESSWFFAKDLASLSLGNAVTLVREEGKWAQVKTETLTGWVLGSSLSVRRILASGAGATASELSLAGKGFSPELEAEYRKDGLDYSIVDAMEKIDVGREELFQFINEGRLAWGQ